MSWGSELWDKYSDLTHHAQNGIDFLEYSVASFIKERGKVEAEYAKSLRNLVKKYSPKGGDGHHNNGHNNNGDNGDAPRRPDEFTHMRAYKQVRDMLTLCDIRCMVVLLRLIMG